MRRLTWFTVGAVTGVYGILKARQAAQNLTPGGISARAAAVGAGLRVFSSEVAAGMAERESELWAQAATTAPGEPALAVPELIGQTTHPRHRREQSGQEIGTDGHR